MAILRAVVNLHERARGENKDRERGRVCAEGVAADLRLIKVNKPFSLLLSWRLKTEIHGCINYLAEDRGKRRGWKGEALNGAQPPPSGRRNRLTYFQIKGPYLGSTGRSRCDFKWRISAVASVCFEICYGLPRDTSSLASNIVWLERLSSRDLASC